METLQDLTVDISQSVVIEANIGDAYQAMIRRFSTDNSTPDNKPMPMVLEQWPGGRWFRDLGNGQGHLWGFVQVIKPPTLIEIHGPMFMSYAVAGHLQLRLTPIAGGVDFELRHQILGIVSDEHRSGIETGWQAFIDGVKSFAQND